MRGCNGASVLAIGSMLLLGGASGSCNEEPAAPATPPAVVEAPGPADAPAPAPAGKPSLLGFEPRSPVAGEPLKIIGGPISFANGCQGIASVEAAVEGQTITVTWTAKEVPPDAVCTMALHDDLVTTTVEGLAAGTYSVKILPSGGEGSIHVRAADEPEPASAPRE